MHNRLLILLFALLPLLAFAGIKNDIRADMSAGRWSAANTRLTTVLKDHPDSAQAHYWMAQVKEHEGQLQAAGEHLARAKTLKPDLSFAGNPLAVEELERRLQTAAPSRHAPAQTGTSSASRITPTAPAAESGHGMFFWLIVGAVLIAILSFVMRLFSRGSDQKLYEGERQQYRDALKQLETELRDAEKAIDARNDWTPEQKFSFSDRVSQAQGDIAKAHYALPQAKDFSGVDALIMRGRDLAAEIRGEEKPSLRQARYATAQQAPASYAPQQAPSAGAGMGGVLAGALAGAAIGSLLSSSAEARTSGHLASQDGYTPLPGTPDDSMSTVDFGNADSSSDNWDSSPDVDTGSGGGDGDW